MAFASTSTTVFKNASSLMIARHHNVGEAFIIAQKHIIFWSKPLDKICFK
jgi:hypothetical protein